MRVILSNSLSALGRGSPSDLSPFYIDDDNYPELIEAIEFCFDDLHWTASLVNNLRFILNFSSQFQFNVIDFNNLSWLRFMNSSPVNIWMKQLLTDEVSLDKMSMEVDVGATEMFLTQTSVHTLTMTTKAWSNTLNKDPEFLVFNHYILCNETDEIIHLQQMNTDEDMILHSGQMYPYSWCSKQSKSLRFCLNSVGDWRWSEPIDLDQVGIFPRKLEHKKFTSLLFVEVKKISGIQSQVIFHGSCSFLNNLDFDIRLCLEMQESQRNTLHPPVVNNVSKDFIIAAGTTRPSISISPSFIKSIGISKYNKESDKDDDQFVISIPQKEDDSHFTIQVQDDSKSLLCWLSFDYTSTIFGQLVVTVSPKFIFRNHFPYQVSIKAIEKDNESVEMVLDGKGQETQVFSLFPEKLYNVYFSLHGSYSKTGFPINTTMHQSMREDGCLTDVELNDGKWPFSQGTKYSVSPQNDSHVWFNHIESEDEDDPTTVQKETKSQLKCNFQATLPWPSLPSVIIDVKPHVLLTNESNDELFIKSGKYIDAVKPNETIVPAHLQKELTVGISLNGNMIWSSPIGICNSSTDQPTKQKVLVPDAVTHCSITDQQNNHCYQLSFTCKNVYGMLSITVHKRFMVHNLSGFNLTMAPLIFAEFKGEHVFEQLSAIQLPPKSDSPFNLLNTFTLESNQVPDGMALNFQITTDDLISENVKDILLSDHTFKECDSLLLSKDHLRETIILSDSVAKQHPLVLTSGLDNGVVHIFVDQDVSVAVTIHNQSKLNLMMKEVNVDQMKKNKHAEVFSTDFSSLVILHANDVTYYQPHNFKENFPKTDNKLELNCQFALFSEDAAELSQPINIEKDKDCKLFVPNHGEIYVKAYINNSKLFVELKDEEAEKIELSLKHLSLPLFNMKLSSIDAVLVDYSNHEKMIGLISASLSRIEFNHIIHNQNSVFKVTCGFMQFDNQVTGTFDHFPVLFLPMRQVSERYHSLTQDVPFSELEACLEADVFSLTFEVNESADGECFINNVRLNMQPCEMYIEDTMVYRLANVFYTYLPRFSASQPVQTDEFRNRCLSVLHPLRLCNIEVGEISILLSFHASIKIFLAADHIPLVFSRFKLNSTQTVPKEFIRSILYNYATQALVRVGWILGSLNIIGSPTGLIQSIGNGLSDFFVLPYNGLIRGPSAFVSGISLGMTSLMRHLSTGALTSINNVTSSISRNMDRLSFDDLHLIMQEESRAESPTKVSKGFSKAFETLGMSLLGAIAGIVDHPIQNVTEANNTSEVLTGIASGFAKGVVGMFTKPIGGAMEFLSQASQGILQGAGLVKVPARVFLLEDTYLEKLVGRESQMKYMQFLHSESYAQILVVPLAVIKTCGDEKVKGESYNGALILTDTTLLVYNSEMNQVASIFSLPEVELLKLDDKTSYKLQINKHANEQQFGTSSLDENPNFRQFFDSFRDAAVASHNEVLCENLSSQSQHAILEVELDPIFGELLVTLCETKKVKLLEDTCVLECVDL